jgi:hypothetical protein
VTNRCEPENLQRAQKTTAALRLPVAHSSVLLLHIHESDTKLCVEFEGALPKERTRGRSMRVCVWFAGVGLGRRGLDER